MAGITSNVGHSPTRAVTTCGDSSLHNGGTRCRGGRDDRHRNFGARDVPAGGCARSILGETSGRRMGRTDAMWHYGLDGANWLWMVFMMAVVWIPIVALAAWFLRGASGDRRHEHRETQ